MDGAKVEVAAGSGEGEGALVLSISGELDPVTADSVRDEVLELAREHRPVELVLDLSAVSFMDSAGVRAVVELHHEQLRCDGRLSLVNIADAPRRVLQLSGLTDELERL